MSKILFYNMILAKLFQKKVIFSILITKKSILWVFFFSLFSLSTNAQSISYPKHQIGLSYSSFSGSGLNYQIELDRTNSLQFTLLPIYLSPKANELEINAIIGSEYQFSLKRFEQSRLYLLIGSSIQHLENRLTTTRVLNDVKITETKIKTNSIFNTGIGVGYEYKLLPRLSASSSLGLLYQLSDNSDNSELWDRNPRGDSFIGVGLSLSIRYIF